MGNGIRQYLEDYRSDMMVHVGKIPLGKTDRSFLHIHPSYEILCIPKGYTAESLIDSQRVKTDYPVLIIIAPFCNHYTYLEAQGIPTERSEQYDIYVGEDFYRDFPEEIPRLEALTGGARARFYDLTGMEEQLFQILDFIRDLQKDYDKVQIADYKQKLAFGLLLSFLEERVQKREGENIEIRDKNYIVDILRYISKNLGERLQTDEIARRFGVSRAKLNRDFFAYTGMTLRHFIMLNRLNCAKILLKNPALSIQEVSEQCGFENKVYFYAFFKRYTNRTPGEYRSQKD